jgi:nicotinamide-nucleotide amidase
MSKKTSEALVRLHSNLIANKWSVATAESCTAGLVAHLLTELSGASAYFDQGWITYSIRAKVELGVIEQEIDLYGVYSPQVAKAMAFAAADKANANFGIGVTGLTGKSDDLNVKDRYVCVAAYDYARHSYKTVDKVFEGTRGQIRRAAASAAIDLLDELVQEKMTTVGKNAEGRVEVWIGGVKVGEQG